MAEVADFEEMLTETLDFCEEVKHNTATTEEKRFAATKWNPEIVLTPHDCSQINSKTGMREELRQKYDNDPRPVVQAASPEKNGKVFGC